MSTKKIEIVTCDMCGAEIDVNDDVVLSNSILSHGYTYVPVHEHNPSYAEKFQTRTGTAQLDLCPVCADRAAAIHLEVIPTEGGRSCRYEYSWRDGR